MKQLFWVAILQTTTGSIVVEANDSRQAKSIAEGNDKPSPGQLADFEFIDIESEGVTVLEVRPVPVGIDPIGGFER